MKPIKDFEGYFIDEHGNVYSSKTGELRKLSTFTYNSGYKAVNCTNTTEGTVLQYTGWWRLTMLMVIKMEQLLTTLTVTS